VNFFEHFSRHLSKDGKRLDKWCKNIGIQEKLRVGIDGKGRFALPESPGSH
jgi:ribosomal protein L32E